MAFIIKEGRRYVVRQGNNGKRLASFATKEDAQAELRYLHDRYQPASENRGARARRYYLQG